MATLEKIRQRKKILAIVIGAALLAFIVEVGIEAIGRSGGNTTVAKVNGDKIDILTYQNRMEKENALAQNDESKKDIDAAIRQQEVLDEMIHEKLLEDEYEELGMYVTDEELTEIMIGSNPEPEVLQMCQLIQQQLPAIQTPAQLNDLIQNPGKYGVKKENIVALQGEWQELQANIAKKYQLEKLQMLLGGCLQANDLDRKAIEEEENFTNVLLYAKVDYSTLDDKNFPVSDAEIKAEWEKLKPLFKLDDAARAIHYIAVSIEPSSVDCDSATKMANAAWNTLLTGKCLATSNKYGAVAVDSAWYAAEELPAYGDYFKGAEVGAAKCDSFKISNIQPQKRMYKLLGKKESIDNITFDIVKVSPDVQNDVLAQLNSGKTIDEVKQAYPQKVEGMAGREDHFANAPDSIKEKFANAPIGQFFVFDSNENGASMIRVVEREPAKMFYNIETVTCEAYASTATNDAIRDKLQNYINNNKNAQKFAGNAAKNGYNASPMLISPSTAQLGLDQMTRQGIKDSRKAIKWAFDKNTKKGDVSPIFSESKDLLIAIAVDDVYDQEYIPWNNPDVRSDLEKRVRNRKKGEYLKKQYAGKAHDMQGFATLMGCQVDTTKITFSNSFNQQIGYEPGLVGRMSVAQKGKLIGPWAGQNAVFVFQAVDQEKDERQRDPKEINDRYAKKQGAAIFGQERAICEILTRTTKVEKHLIDFM